MSEAVDIIDGLNAQESAAIAALMSSPTIEHAAARVGIHERTLRRWLCEREAFRHVLRNEQRAVMSCVTSRLQRAAVKAIGALEEIIVDRDAPHAARVSAARAVLELAHERIDIEDLTERLEAVEQARQPGRRA